MTATHRACLYIALGLTIGAESARAGAKEVGPETGLLFDSSFLFRRPGEILGSSGRGGTFLTRNKGEHWQRSMRGLTNALGVEALSLFTCQSRSSSSVLYAATFDGLYRSDDFGSEWDALAAIPDPLLNACDVDPRNPDIAYAMASGFFPPHFMLAKTTDGGASFAVVGNGLPVLDQAFEMRVAPTDPATLYIVDFGTFQGTYVSHDGGVNFARLDTAPDFPFHVFPSPSVDGTVFIAADALYRSTDGGATFQPVLAQPINDVVFDPLESSTLYAAAGPAGVFRSQDGGETFAPFAGIAPGQGGAIGAAAFGVQITKSGRTLYLNTDRGNFRSDDGGRTFVPIERGYHGASVNDLVFDAGGRLLVPVNSSAGIFRSSKPGTYEVVGATLPDTAVSQVSAIAASPDNPDVYVAATIGGLFLTADGGASWTQSETTAFTASSRAAFATSDARKVYAVGFTALFWSIDGGQSFGRTTAGRFGSLAVDPTNADVVYVGDWTADRGVFKSTDGGRTLQRTGLTAGNFSALAIDPQNPAVVYAGHRTGTVFRSLDGGATFAPTGTGLAGAGVLGLGIELSTGRLYAWISGGGLFRSDDGAASWTPVDTGEALRRSGLTGGRSALAFDPSRPGRIFLGGRSVIEVNDGEQRKLERQDDD